MKFLNPFAVFSLIIQCVPVNINMLHRQICTHVYVCICIKVSHRRTALSPTIQNIISPYPSQYRVLLCIFSILCMILALRKYYNHVFLGNIF